MRADKVMVWIVLGLILVVGALLIKNRGSEKIFTALTVILSTTLATGLGSLLLILRPETMEEDFVSVFIYDMKDISPLIGESFPIRKRFMHTAEIWDKTDQDQKQGEPLNVLRHYLARCMVEELLQKYHGAWLIQTKAWNVPGSSQASWGPVEEADRLPKTELPIDEILTALKAGGNRFADVKTTGSSIWGSLSLPPDTRFSYSSNAGYDVLGFTNTYVTTEITIYRSSMGVLQQNFYDVFETSEGDPNRYYQVSFRVKIKSQFSSWRAGWERMAHQKRWAGSMARVLRDVFDWEKCAAEIRDAWEETQLSKISQPSDV